MSASKPFLDVFATNSAQLIPLYAREFLRLALGFLAAQRERDRSTAGVVVKAKIDTRPAVKEADLIGAAVRYCRRRSVFEQADFHAA